jgi:hypothetical protein
LPSRICRLGDRDRVDVHLHHPGVGGDLVHVALGRDAGADVEELAHTSCVEVADGAAEERPVGARGCGDDDG